MTTLRINSLITAAFLLIISCAENILQEPAEKETAQFRITAANRCAHNTTLYRIGAAGATVADAPAGTVYECQAGEVHEAQGGEAVYTEHWVDNTEGSSFSLNVSGANDFVLETAAAVEIADPQNMQYRNTNGNWVTVTESCSVVTSRISVNEGGSGTIYNNNKTILGIGIGKP